MRSASPSSAICDWTAFALLAVLIGHVAKAFGDRGALGGMVGGTVSRRWAAKKAPRWLAEVSRGRGVVDDEAVT